MYLWPGLKTVGSKRETEQSLKPQPNVTVHSYFIPLESEFARQTQTLALTHAKIPTPIIDLVNCWSDPKR